MKTSIEPARAAAAPSRSAPAWARLTATFLGIGYLPFAPGTWASVATIALWFALANWMEPAWRLPAAIVLAVLATVLGIPAATRVARAAGKKDPRLVVVDEVAGQMIAILGAPLGWKTMLAGLILFRAFDILKPPPLRQLERLPEGAGIVLDDVGAGLYALALLHLLLRWGVL